MLERPPNDHLFGQGYHDDYAQCKAELEETREELDRARTLTLELEKNLEQMGRLRVDLEKKLAEKDREKLRLLEAKEQECVALKRQYATLQQHNRKLAEKTQRMEKELMQVLAKKYELVEAAKRDARREMADQERIRQQLREQNRRNNGSAAAATETPMQPPVHDPRTVRSTNALQELRDFFDE